MKVVHLSYADGGGGACKAAYRIHRSLVGQHVDSVMLVSRKFNNDTTVLDPGSPLGRIWAHVTSYLDQVPQKVFPANNKFYSSVSWVGTGSVAKANLLCPDIVNLHWINSGFMRIGEIGKIKCPVVWRLADMWPFAGMEHYVDDGIRFMEGYSSINRSSETGYPDISQWTWERKRKSFGKIDDMTIVAPSRWLADCARKSFLFRDRRIEVIPTGQNVDVFRPIRKEIAREILGLPLTGKYILTSAMQLNNPIKGFDLLLEALKLMHEKDYVLLTLGEGVHAPDVPLPVHVLGRFNDDLSLALVYSAADVFVAASRLDNLPNTVIESLACGTPVVSFDVGGLSDLVRDNHTGYLVKPFDVRSFSESIRKILEDDMVRFRMSVSARRLIVSEYSEEVQCHRYLDLYDDILANKNVF
jgi:glycosyltransferase involved in cell wall biosynthesis